MTESYAQFLARTDGAAKPRPPWASALLFLALFSLLQTGYSASRGSAFEHLVIGTLTVAPAAALIRTLTPGVTVIALGNQLLSPGGGIVVKKGCEGIEVMFMLVAAFAAVVMPWRHRLAGMVIGMLLVFCLNQIRLAALFYAYRSDPVLFNFLHGTLAPLLLVIFVALFALYWFRLPGPVVRTSVRHDA